MLGDGRGFIDFTNAPKDAKQQLLEVLNGQPDRLRPPHKLGEIDSPGRLNILERMFRYMVDVTEIVEGTVLAGATSFEDVKLYIHQLELLGHLIGDNDLNTDIQAVSIFLQQANDEKFLISVRNLHNRIRQIFTITLSGS